MMMLHHDHDHEDEGEQDNEVENNRKFNFVEFFTT